jgi:hypothetical protein
MDTISDKQTAQMDGSRNYTDTEWLRDTPVRLVLQQFSDLGVPWQRLCGTKRTATKVTIRHG